MENLKYIVVVGDGMADLPDADGNTPLTLANKPVIDRLSKSGELGLVRTVADGQTPGSDIANLAVLGYDPAHYYTGRSPLEAASIGIELGENDIALRCNFVTLQDGLMKDYSAGEISTAEASQLIGFLQRALGAELYCGTGYRHCLVIRDGKLGTTLTPPHDITGKPYSEYMPEGENAAYLLGLFEKAARLLPKHPVNIRRVRQGLASANAVWFWGEGTRPELTPFEQKTGLKGAVISAVDLIKGIGRLAGMEVLENERFSGTLDTDYELKAATALNALERNDFVFVHVEASDECGHRGEFANKTLAIEYLDSRIVEPITQALDSAGTAYRILILPDHATPVSLLTHTADPVPYILYDSRGRVTHSHLPYTEAAAASTNVLREPGFKLIERLLRA